MYSISVLCAISVKNRCTAWRVDQTDLYLRFQTSSFYENCACVMSKADPIGKVEKGVCQVDCGLKLLLLLLVLSAIALMTFLNDTPALVVTLRYYFLTVCLFVSFLLFT